MEEIIKTPEVETTTESATTFMEVVKNCIVNGAKRINGLKVKNINFDEDYEDKSYIRISFTVDRAIPGFVTNDGGATYEKGNVNVVFTSSFALAGLIKENEDLAWMANTIANKPKALSLIFSGATIDILQMEYPTGTPVVNPFSKNTEGQIYDHDVITNNVIAIKLSKSGERFADKLADKMLDE